MALIGLNQTEQAWQQVRAALELNAPRGWNAWTTWMLPVVGIILAQQGQPERASKILSLYFNQVTRPIGWVEKWPLLSEWQVRLQENLGADKFQAAWEQGRTLDRMAAVEALLTEGKEAP